MLFDVLLLLSLGSVTLWFFWPNISDAAERFRAQQKTSATDQDADKLFQTWARSGPGAVPVFRSYRS